MLRKYFLINRVLLLTARRKVKAAVRGRLFYLFIGCIVVLCGLIGFGSIVSPAVQTIVSGIALGGDARNFAAIVGSFFTNATMEASALYLLWSFFSSRDTDMEKMLGMYGVPRFLRNLSYRANTVVLLFLISFILYNTLVLPGIALSALTFELKLGMLAFTSLQICFTLVCVSVLDAALSILLKRIHAPLPRAVRLLALLAILVSYFIGYFTEASRFGEGQSALYQISSLTSFFLLAFMPSTGIALPHLMSACLACFAASLAFLGLCRIEEPTSPCLRSWIFLGALPFFGGYWSIVSKVVKEQARNKDRSSSIICIAAVFLVLKITYPEAFDNELFALAVSLPAMNFLYTTGNENEMRAVYRICRVRASRVVACGILATSTLTAAEMVFLALFFPLNLVLASAPLIAASVLFIGGTFYLLGILFPLDKDHPFSSQAIIALLILAMVPTTVVVMQFMQALGLDMSATLWLLAVLGVCLSIVASLVLKKKLGLG